MSTPIIMATESGGHRGAGSLFKWVSPCHTGLFVQSSHSGAGFFLPLNQNRVFETIKKDPWLGPSTENRSSLDTWLGGSVDYWGRLRARDDLGCFVQRDPIDFNILWGGGASGCGTTESDKRFWATKTPSGERLFLHHNLTELNTGEGHVHGINTPAENPILKIQATIKPEYDESEVVAEVDLEILHPHNLASWNFHGSGYESYFVMDVHPEGNRILFGASPVTSQTLVSSRMARQLGYIGEITITVSHNPDNGTTSLNAQLEILRSEDNNPNSETGIQWGDLFAPQPGIETNFTHSLYITNVETSHYQTSHRTWEINPANVIVLGIDDPHPSDSLFIGHVQTRSEGGRSMTHWKALGAFYGKSTPEDTEPSILYVTMQQTFSEGISDVEFDMEGFIGTGGIMSYSWNAFLPGGATGSGGPIAISMPPQTASASLGYSQSVYMNGHQVFSTSTSQSGTVEDPGYILEARINLDVSHLYSEDDPDHDWTGWELQVRTTRLEATYSSGASTSSTFFPPIVQTQITNNSTARDIERETGWLNKYYETVMAHTRWPDGYHPDHDPPPERPPSPIMFFAFGAVHYVPMTAQPRMLSNFIISNNANDTFNNMYSNSHGRTLGSPLVECFLDFHGGAKAVSESLSETYPVPTGAIASLTSTTHRSKVAVWDDDIGAPVLYGETCAYIMGPPTTYASRNFYPYANHDFQITPIHELHDCASFNPVTKQLAYGFNAPVCWQGNWGYAPNGASASISDLGGGCASGEDSYVMYRLSLPSGSPRGVVKLIEPVYIPSEADMGYVAGWVGEPLPDDPEKGC